MNKIDRTYLQDIADKFIWAGINRVSHSGDMMHAFRFGADDLKAETNRQRLHDAIINEVVDFFRNALIDATYDQGSATFLITLNLSRCALNHSQADALSTAMSAFRAENC